MSHYQLRPSAETDLDSISAYTARNWSKTQADIYINKLFDAFDLIGGNPRIGKSCDAILPGYRCLYVESHYIYYSLQDASLPIITRILHHSQDAERALGLKTIN